MTATLAAPERTRPERRQRWPWRACAGMYGFVTLLHVLGWGTLVLFVLPEGYQVGGKVFGIGLGLTAYTLGMRHAFDADHIAAIDNTTRKLMSDGGRPKSVGFWFAMG
ncbi:MAG: HoxN/HupN/NixA family nickel/cobalt transporter, partial [Marmoricola sp.]